MFRDVLAFFLTLYPPAIVLAALGAAGFLWSMFRDRSRGRRRCPKCWYDMSGTPGLTCPECGRTVKRERRLFKTRRRWRLAALSVLFIVAGLATWYGQHVRRLGWIRAAPTVYYIARLPDLDPDTSFRELREREARGDMREWEYRLLIHRCIGVLGARAHDPETLVRVADLLTDVEIRGRMRIEHRPWDPRVRVSEIDLDGAINALVGLLNHDDPEVRLAALFAVDHIGGEMSIAIPGLLGQLVTDDAEVRAVAAARLWWRTYDTSFLRPAFEPPRPSLVNSSFPGWAFNSALDGKELDLNEREGFPFEWPLFQWDPRDFEWARFLEALGSCGTDVERASRAMEKGLESPDPEVRAISVWALAQLNGDDQRIASRILDLADDENERVRRVVIQVSSFLPLSDRLDAVIDRAMLTSENLRREAIRAIGRRGASGATFSNHIRAELDRGYAGNLDLATQAWARIGGDPIVAARVVLGPVRNPPDEWGSEQIVDALMHLGAIGAESSEVCDVIEPMLSASDVRIRSAAAYAFAMCGGDRERVARLLIDLNRNGWSYSMSYLKELAKCGRASIDALFELLDSEDRFERRNAAEALGEAGALAQPALGCLRELHADEDWQVAIEAQRAVKRIEYALTHEDQE
jgi:HEAT repeat protein